MSKHLNIVYKTNLKYGREKYQKMEVSKFLYFALLSFNLMLFTLWPSILFHDQFTNSLLHCLHPVLVNCEISLDWIVRGISMLSAKIGERHDMFSLLRFINLSLDREFQRLRTTTISYQETSYHSAGEIIPHRSYSQICFNELRMIIN